MEGLPCQNDLAVSDDPFPTVLFTAEVCCPQVHLSGFPVWKNLSSNFCIFINADAFFFFFFPKKLSSPH